MPPSSILLLAQTLQACLNLDESTALDAAYEAAFQDVVHLSVPAEGPWTFGPLPGGTPTAFQLHGPQDTDNPLPPEVNRALEQLVLDEWTARALCALLNHRARHFQPNPSRNLPETPDLEYGNGWVRLQRGSFTVRLTLETPIQVDSRMLHHDPGDPLDEDFLAGCPFPELKELVRETKSFGGQVLQCQMDENEAWFLALLSLEQTLNWLETRLGPPRTRQILPEILLHNGYRGHLLSAVDILRQIQKEPSRPQSVQEVPTVREKQTAGPERRSTTYEVFTLHPTIRNIEIDDYELILNILPQQGIEQQNPEEFLQETVEDLQDQTGLHLQHQRTCLLLHPCRSEIALTRMLDVLEQFCRLHPGETEEPHALFLPPIQSLSPRMPERLQRFIQHLRSSHWTVNPQGPSPEPPASTP